MAVHQDCEMSSFCKYVNALVSSSFSSNGGGTYSASVCTGFALLRHHGGPGGHQQGCTEGKLRACHSVSQGKKKKNYAGGWTLETQWSEARLKKERPASTQQ